MRRPQSTKDESIACTWLDIRDYDARLELGGKERDNRETVSSHCPWTVMMTFIVWQVREEQSTKGRMQQLKETSSRKLTSIKNQLSGIYR